MSPISFSKESVLPTVIAAGIVAASAVIYKLWIAPSKKKTPVTLENSSVKYQLEIIDKEIISHDTRKFRFKLPTENHILGLPVGQHIYLSARVNGKLVIRPYTPVTSDDNHGYMDLVVKVYFKNVHPKFPDGGKMSQYLDCMNMGDPIDVRGPSGYLIYKGKGEFSIKKTDKGPWESVRAKTVGLIAGGTGITPMLQLIRQIFKDPQDNMTVWLLYANQTPQDILLRDELENVARENGDRFKLWYTVDRADSDDSRSAGPGWRYSTGFVDADMMKNHLPPPSDDTMILMCGPPPMIKYACQPNLDLLGYSQEMRFAY